MIVILNANLKKEYRDNYNSCIIMPSKAALCSHVKGGVPVMGLPAGTWIVLQVRDIPL